MKTAMQKKDRATTYEKPLKISGGFVGAVKALVREPKTTRDK